MSLYSILLVSSLVWAQAPEGVPVCPADAALKSIQFVDADEGWCVGEEGVILHSIDAGKNWEKQSSATQGTLEAVRFLNPYFGWAVGHDDRFAAQSNGIVLYTRDGGITWKRILAGEVPALYGVAFQGKEVWLAGVANLRFPGGTIVTHDGGVRWQAGPAMPVRGWLGVNFDGASPRLFGPQGKTGLLENDQGAVRDADPNGQRPMRAIYSGAGQAIAAGEAGLFLREREGRWEPITGAFGAQAQALVDFHCLCGVGDLRFAAGAMGQVLLRSEDAGATWKRMPVAGLGTINSIHFADAKKGWMAGERGAIWRTENGGLQWQQMRGDGGKTSHLAIVPGVEKIPAAALALLGWVDGVHCGLYLAGSHPSGEAGHFRSGEIAARRALGMTSVREGFGSFTQSIPAIASRAEVLELLETTLGPQPLEALKRKLALEIRRSQPEALLLSSEGADPNYRGFEALLEEVVGAAVLAAADPNQFPELAQELHLPPWQVRKGFTPGSISTHHVRIDLMEARPRFRASIKDYCAEHDLRKSLGFARNLASADKAELFYKGQWYVSASEKNSGKRLTFLDMENAQGWVEVQRKLETLPELTSLELRAIRKKNQVMQLVGSPDSQLASSETLASSLEPMLKGVDDVQAARVLMALARQSQERGNWNLARELYLRFLDRYPTHPQAVEAAQWVILHNASGEARRRHELRQVLVEGVIDFQTTAAPREDSGAGSGSFQSLTPQVKPTPRANAGAVNPAVALAVAMQEGSAPIASPIPNLPQTLGRVTTQSSFVENVLEAKKWYQEALSSGKGLAVFGSLVASDPRMRLSLASASRKLGDFRPTQEYCEEIVRGSGGADPSIDSWRKAAAMELWLSHRKGEAPKPLWTARKTEARPYLDGNLQEPFWEAAVPYRYRALADRSPVKGERVEAAGAGPMVCFANDDQFLYVGIRVESLTPGLAAQEKSKRRGHDTDLSQVENISLLIDVDRDYSTAYWLRFDERGWIDDSCWNDSGWNPRWFIATRKQGGYWETELAIPLAILASEKPAHGKSWAVNLFHHDPARRLTYGLNGSKRPPSEDLDPQDFGILYFQSPRARPTDRSGAETSETAAEETSGPRSPAKRRPGASRPGSAPEPAEPSTPLRTNSDR